MPKNADTKMLAHAQPEQPATLSTNVRLPIDLYEALRREAFERRVSQGFIVAEALRAYLSAAAAA